MDVAAAARGGGADAAFGARPSLGITGKFGGSRLRQAGRELMLAQASDWPFIITNGTTEQYARRRFQDHMHRFHDLLAHLERREIDPTCLQALEHMDALFPKLDYQLFASE